MRILAHVHGYPPAHNAGAELMLHTILRDLVRRGHACRVIATQKANSGTHEGVEVWRAPAPEQVADLYQWADVAMTHLDCTAAAVRQAHLAGRPLVHLAHNHLQLERQCVGPGDAQLVVFNSHWLRERVGWRGPQLVLPPPIFAADYATTPGDCITLINLTEAKGAPLFYELARRLPERRFVGVRGAYGHQIVPDQLPENVEILPNTPDVRRVYARTRILLTPSSYESWGRVAIEAAASGIPTIAHPTPGLLESLGPAGLFADRADVAAWLSQIRALDDPESYRRQAELARARTTELDPAPHLDRLEAALSQLIYGNAGSVDFVAHLPHYVDHLAPVWHALPSANRGTFFVRGPVAEHARRRGIEPATYQGDTDLVSQLAGAAGPVVTAGFGNLRAANRTGRPQIYAEHGAGQSYAPHTDPAYAGARTGRERVVLFLVPNAYTAALNRAAFPQTQVAVVGCPKLDAWHARPPKPRGDPPIVAISFHWDGPAFPETRTSWPHFKPALPALAGRFRLLGHGHPRILDELASEYRKAGIPVVRDFAAVLEQADLYVCDNSSTLFEFAATDRPVVVLNAPWYRRDMRHGLRFWDCANVGVNCDSPADLIRAVEQALLDPPEQAASRRRAVAAVYAVRDGAAASRAAEAILDTLRRCAVPGLDPVGPVEMRALASFAGAEGEIRREAVFHAADAERARYLWHKRLAYPTAGPLPVRPAATREFPQPASEGGEAVRIRMRATATFTGEEGFVRRGREFEVAGAARAAFLRARGLAVPIHTAAGPAATKPAGPSATKPAGPAAVKDPEPPVRPSDHVVQTWQFGRVQPPAPAGPSPPADGTDPGVGDGGPEPGPSPGTSAGEPGAPGGEPHVTITYHCDQCGKGFTSERGLLTHQQRMHKPPE